jgi:FAD/FMN-containing dehydrogenase
MSEEFLIALRTIADSILIEDPFEMQPHLVDWRKRHEGTALAVALPRSTQAVSEIVSLCSKYRVPIFPQGGTRASVAGLFPTREAMALLSTCVE